jgi:hypothetical protein
MKIDQFRNVLQAAEELYRHSGNEAAAESLREILRLLDGCEAMSVSAFSNMIANIAAEEDGSGRMR